MDTENATPQERQGNGVSKEHSKIKAIGEWIIKNSDAVLKLTASFVAVAATILVAGYQSKMSAISLISEREQAESNLRATMFSHLITPFAGPFKEGEGIDPHRERILIELLALNFHEHFEFKPLMMHVDERLSGKYGRINSGRLHKGEKQVVSEEDDIKSLRSIARRITGRQIALLIKEGIKEPVSLELDLNDQTAKADFGQGDFGNTKLFNTLLMNELIVKDGGKDRYKFSDAIENEPDLERRLKAKNVKSGDGRIINLWRRTNPDKPVIQMPGEQSVPIRLQQFVRLTPPETKEGAWVGLFPATHNKEPRLSVEMLVSEIDGENETVTVEFSIIDKANNGSQEIPQKFQLSWYDFPLTDNTILQDENRFSIVLASMEKGGKGKTGAPSVQKVVLKVIWFPKGYFTARERPIKHEEFREKLGI